MSKWDERPMFALDADVTVYWPEVRPCFEREDLQRNVQITADPALRPLAIFEQSSRSTPTQQQILQHPCDIGAHRPAWRTDGSIACGYCGKPCGGRH